MSSGDQEHSEIIEDSEQEQALEEVTLDQLQDPRLKPLIRALLLASEKPLTAQTVVELISEAVDEEEWPKAVSESEVVAIFRQIQAELQPGIELIHVAEGWRYRTAPDLGFMVRRLWPERAIRLSRAALEALSVVAYRQPCTRTDVEDVRGVDCSGVMRSLLERKLLKIVGHKEDVGRPLLYATTPEFLELFSLSSLSELPRLRDLEALHEEEAAREKGFRPAAKEAAKPAPVSQPTENSEETTKSQAVENSELFENADLFEDTDSSSDE